jgi:hypothetical protein
LVSEEFAKKNRKGDTEVSGSGKDVSEPNTEPDTE